MRDRDIFLSALDYNSPERRNAYLVEVCGDDVALRSRVEALLQAAEVEDSFLERPVLGERSTQHFNGDTAATDGVGSYTTASLLHLLL